MVRKTVFAVLWVASLAAVGAAASARASQTPQPTSVAFGATRIASSNGFTLLRVSSGPSIVECYIVHETSNGVGMAPAKCPY
jgi:hypothetical protein